jgi:hypothetical protein
LYSLPQQLLAEFIGTFTVVFAAAGAVCADQYLRGPGQSGFGVLGYALAYGLAIAVMVGAVGLAPFTRSSTVQLNSWVPWPLPICSLPYFRKPLGVQSLWAQPTSRRTLLACTVCCWKRS